jgi:uncharacterized protein YyaL (SSP411 family)
MRRLLALLLIAALAPAAAADPRPEKPKHTNRLSKETSPYLLQHAHNPVDWFPWGDEAFAKAKKEGKLVFLSIGYSSCHWCHVMERESFSDEDVAKVMNKHFVCIKVDREERPDIDHVYMTALHAMGQRGGWPLSMWLTSDGKPIVGGTYWPKEDREIDGEKARGFKSLLLAVQKFHEDAPEKVKEHADKMAKETTDLLIGGARGVPLVDLDRPLVTAAVDALLEEFDPEHGGFGLAKRQWKGPKFPTPPALGLLEHETARTGAKDYDKALTLTLDRMARGGIYDHIGGGFHRYSTERTWTVPHFEKMLYDNAQLLEVYGRALKRVKEAPLYRRALRQTIDFVLRELTAPDGGFYSALDADSEGEEGRFYVWTAKDLDAALAEGEARKLFKTVYDADGAPNFEDKYHILLLKRPLSEVAKERKTTEAELDRELAPLREQLLVVRAKRPRPFLDTKVLTAWNGQMIAGLAVAGDALGDRKAIEAAKRAADFVLKNLKTKDGRLLRTWGAAPGEKAEARLNGYLDDYAFLVHGLLTLHDVTGEARWLDEAKALTETMVEWHGDKVVGAFYYTSNDHEKLFARSKDQYDGAQPSGNSLAAKNLARLWVKTGDEKYAKLTEKTIRALAIPLKNNPTSLPGLAEALAVYLDGKERKK